MIRKFSNNFLCIVFLSLINCCGYKNVENTQFHCERLSLDCDIQENILVFYTSKGIIKIELFADSHPVTVANFISKVKSKIYNNKNFYKIISYSSNKLIQNGLNKINYFGNMNIEDLENFASIPLEIKLKNKEPIYETSIINPQEIKNLLHKFEKGSLSMVKINEKRSSSTEFFFSLNNLPEFDGRYSIFGRVISGREILDKIDKNDLIKKFEFN